MAELFCDICGKSPVRAQILIEGARLLACASCMRSGKVLHRFYEDEDGEPIVPSAPPPSSLDSGEEIVDDCGKIIKACRDRLKLPLAVVAERISEKESYLDAIETGRLMPSLAVAKKLEKELGVKLIEKVAASVAPSTPAASGRFTPPTLADMLTAEKGKKKK